LLASLIGLITVVSMVLVSTLVVLERRRLVSSLELQAEATADQLVTTLAFPIWNAIMREIDAQLDWVMLDKAVYGISLTMNDILPSPRERSRDKNGAATLQSPGNRSGLVIVHRGIRYENKPIASLELKYSKHLVEARITREAILFAVLVLVEDITIALGLLLILRSSIFRPLRKIERFAASVSSGSVSSIPPWEGMRGEIESLHLSIEKMVSLLGERYAAIVAKEEEFRSLFESSPVPTIELDFSAIPAAIEAEGVSTVALRPKLLSEPDIARRLLALVRTRSANASAVRLYGGAWSSKIIESFSAHGEEPLALFVDELADLISFSEGASGECGLLFDAGEERRFILDFATLAGHEKDWSRVILTMTDITGRALAEARLRKALAEKDILVQELFHRTRNSLQIVAGLVSLREARLSDERSRVELRSLAKRVQAMALAQDQLHKLNDLSYVDLGEYLKALIPLIAGNTGGQIRVVVESQKVTTVIDVAMPLGIALVELTTNAIEHGFPDGRAGTISVTLALKEDGCIEIVMRDDGIGPPPGFDPRRDASMGLELVFILVEGQLRGRVDFDYASGFSCALRFGVECFEHRV
jgi:two-component sensor histidine kinase/HAMP domain-containing protein